MTCDILDWRCIFVNELVGSTALAILLIAVLYFIWASKIRLGFDKTVITAIPLLLITALVISYFSAIYAFATLIGAVLLGWIFLKVFELR